MEKRVDLHTHTNASDGSDKPAALVEKAAALGLAAVAVTDHDTTDGIAEAQRAGAALGVEAIPGIEISADHLGNRAHILGLFIDPAAPSLRRVTHFAIRERLSRNLRMIEAMQADGFDISHAALRAEYPNAVLGRPHMAEHLMKKGYVSSVGEAFDRYFAKGRPYYRARRRVSLTEAAEAIRGAGGIAVIAHPLQYGYPEEELLAYLDAARAAGCAAIEAYYSEHSPEERDYVKALAAHMGLLVSGGSDYHGTRKPEIALGSGMNGGLRVPYAVLETLRASL